MQSLAQFYSQVLRMRFAYTVYVCLTLSRRVAMFCINSHSDTIFFIFFHFYNIICYLLFRSVPVEGVYIQKNSLCASVLCIASRSIR